MNLMIHIIENEAFKSAIETEKYPLGIFYKNSDNITFEESLSAYKTDKSPLLQERS